MTMIRELKNVPCGECGREHSSFQQYSICDSCKYAADTTYGRYTGDTEDPLYVDVMQRFETNSATHKDLWWVLGEVHDYLIGATSIDIDEVKDYEEWITNYFGED